MYICVVMDLLVYVCICCVVTFVAVVVCVCLFPLGVGAFDDVFDIGCFFYIVGVGVDVVLVFASGVAGDCFWGD